MYIVILGRQPALSLAELEQVYGSSNVTPFSATSALVNAEDLSITRLGGALKAGKVAFETIGDWRRVSQRIVSEYSKQWSGIEGKITLGLSVYDLNVPTRDIQRPGIQLKSALKKSGGSLRLVPNSEPALNTATSHHNKLGLSPNKIELIIVRGASGKIIVAESTGAQNITALARRDQERPKRDAFVGMLPPKLAQIMINLTGIKSSSKEQVVLDPFCGTGVVLQEAALMGFSVYGTDLNEKMIRYSSENLDWLKKSHDISFDSKVTEGDAMTTKWQQPISAVVCEGYLGQPFSAPPSAAKLTEVRRNCDHIMSSFLKNIAPQLGSGTPLCVAVPAWRDLKGNITRLPFINKLSEIGYKMQEFTYVVPDDLVYFREDQIVARELLVLIKK